MQYTEYNLLKRRVERLGEELDMNAPKLIIERELQLIFAAYQALENSLAINTSK